MKRIISIFVAILLCVFTLCSCESKEAKAARKAKEAAGRANNAYQDALSDYNNLQNYYNKNY